MNSVLLIIICLFGVSLCRNHTIGKRDIEQLCVPYTGQTLAAGSTFVISDMTVGEFLSVTTIDVSYGPTGLVFAQAAAVFSFAPNTMCPYSGSQYSSGVMGILQVGNQQFDLDGSVGGMLTCQSSPAFFIALVPVVGKPGVVTLQGVQSNYQSNQYPLNIDYINGERCLSYGNNNEYDTYSASICTGLSAQPTAWTCVPGINGANNVPVRINAAGDIECMAPDGANCLWTTGSCTAEITTPPSTIVPLACGQMHLKLYGITGYDTKTHWCFTAWEYLKNWLCLPGITSPVRINPMGNPECLATDGANCLWNTVSCTSIQNYDASSISNINPLTCGQYHNSKYGITGYNTPTHWCFESLQQLEPMCIKGTSVTFSTEPSATGTFNCPLSGS